MKQPRGPRPPIRTGGGSVASEIRNEIAWDLYDLSLFLRREWADWEAKLIQFGDWFLRRIWRRR
jgi:hypothetical protein